MALFQWNNLLVFLGFLLFFCMKFKPVSSHNRHYTPPSVPSLTDRFQRVSIDKSFSPSFGAHNIKLSNNASMATISLDKTSGSGLISKNKYDNGFFSAAIKLPSGLSSGVVLAFYLSNADVYPHNHDEIDIELLGHDKRNDWVMQTNVYANGSVSTGREEKFYFWFDPTANHHYYSILWNTHHIVFLIDNIPVREFPNSGKFASAYPSKPMSVHATIWDGSEWATNGGKYPVNYKYAPFVASLAEVEMSPADGQEFSSLSKQQTLGLNWARNKLMFYSYCKDTSRYKVLPAECT